MPFNSMYSYRTWTIVVDQIHTGICKFYFLIFCFFSQKDVICNKNYFMRKNTQDRKQLLSPDHYWHLCELFLRRWQVIHLWLNSTRTLMWINEKTHIFHKKNVLIKSWDQINYKLGLDLIYLELMFRCKRNIGWLITFACYLNQRFF